MYEVSTHSFNTFKSVLPTSKLHVLQKGEENYNFTVNCNRIKVLVLRTFPYRQGWSGGAMVLGKLPVPGRPTNLDYSRARDYCACSRCGWRLFGHFFSLIYHFISFLPPSLWETSLYRLKYVSKCR